jgi:hypothetical protein
MEKKVATPETESDMLGLYSVRECVVAGMFLPHQGTNYTGPHDPLFAIDTWLKD